MQGGENKSESILGAPIWLLFEFCIIAKDIITHHFRGRKVTMQHLNFSHLLKAARLAW